MKNRFLTFRYTVKLLWSMTHPAARVIALIFLAVSIVLIATSQDPVGWGLLCGFLLLVLFVSSVVIYRLISQEMDK